MRRFLALLTAPLLVADAAPRAIHKASWSMPVAGSGWIAFERLASGHILIPISLDGEPAWAIVDTGFRDLTINSRWAAAHHLALIPWGSTLSAGGSTTFFQVDGVSMTIGDAHTAVPGGFAAVDLGNVPTLMGRRIDAIIGLDLLAIFGWEVDEDGARFRLVPGGSLPFSAPSRVRLGPDGPGKISDRLVTDIDIGNVKAVPTMVDTGSDGDLEITPGIAAAAGLRATTDRESHGAGGTFVEQIATGQPVDALGRRINSLLIGITGPASGVTKPLLPAVIGMGALSRFNLRVDLTRGLMQLDDRRTPSTRASRTNIGVQGVKVGAELRISHVMANSPAQAAGLTADDTICAVNGLPLTDRTIADWRAAAPGLRYMLKLCDGRTVPLTTRSFY